MPRVSLEQWRAFVSVVDAGGYAAAAQRMHRSQSSVSHAVAKLESSLGLKLLEVRGRKSELTTVGVSMLRRARSLLDEAGRIELGARALAAGVEAKLAIAAEILFPTWLMLECMAAFSEQFPHTRVELIESVLGGTDEALYRRDVDLALAGSVPAGFSGEQLMLLRMLPVAHPDHPLHHLGREPSLRDLSLHRQLVIRDTAVEHKREGGGWLGAEQRWTVSNKATSIAAACAGLGFAWYSEDTIRRELDDGVLKPLPLKGGKYREVPIYLIYAEQDFAGPAVSAMAEILRERVQRACRGADT